MNTEYHYILMSQQDLLQNEVIEEIVRERTNSYMLQNKKNDFWIVISPKFIENSNLTEKLKQTNFYRQRICSTNSTNKKDFYGAIVSFNKEFITWLSLRLGYFENLETFQTVLVANKNYVSNGAYGKFSIVNQDNSPFFSNPRLIHPTILTNKYRTLLDSFYKIN